MKYKIGSLVLIAAMTMIPVALSADSGCAPGGKCEVRKAGAIPELSTADLEALLKKDSSVILLDARSGKYDDGRRIPGAKSLNDKSSKAEVEAVVKDKDTKIVTYCSNLQCPASGRLAEHLKELGYKNVHEYPEGIDGWEKAGKKVDKVK